MRWLSSTFPSWPAGVWMLVEAVQLGRTPLHLAAENGQESTVTYLVRHGADMEALEWVSDAEAACLT